MRDVESFLLGIVAGDGNPNYAEYENVTLDTMFDGVNVVDLADAISRNQITLTARVDGQTLNAAFLGSFADEIVFSFVVFDAPDDATPTGGVSVYYSSAGDLIYARANLGNGTWITLPASTSAVRTIIHHPWQ